VRNHIHLDKRWLPAIGAGLTAFAGLLNIASALTPDIRWRGHLVLQLEGVKAVEIFHALALPVGGALLLVSPYLFKRRRRALRLAVGLLLVIGIVNLLKGLDFEVSLAGWLVAALLFWARDEFTVIQNPITPGSALWRVPLIGVSGMALVGVADWATSGRPKVGKIRGEIGALIRFKAGHQHLDQHTISAFGHQVSFAWMPLATHFVEVATLLGIAYVLFKPLAAPSGWPSASVRRQATDLVLEHGHDTLAFFKLRPDKLYFFNAARTAFVGYRIEAGALLVSGDPVGPPECHGGLLLEVRRFARSRGLKLAAMGASEELLPIYEGLGMHTFYMGDEAVIEVDAFSLEGRPIRKVRQSVNRLLKAGYTPEVCTLDQIDASTMEQMQHLLRVGRIGDAERGFAMGMDDIRGVLEQDTLFVLARDADQRLRGVLHFVPCYGRSAMSLSIMRRDPESPNGLMEFLVVATIEAMRERGIAEVSLNFATFSKYMHDPHGLFERLVAIVAHRLDGYMQIESLYRFNVKFQPRWNPRYLIYEGHTGLLRAGLASLWAEGQIPKPKLPRRNAHKGQHTLKTANR